MNITSKISQTIDTKYKDIIESNKEIQFYSYNGVYYWRDSRFFDTHCEWVNKPCNTIEELQAVFINHIDSRTIENLEKKRDDLIKKYLQMLTNLKTISKQSITLIS
jgi:hypothetical protein